MSQNTPSQSAPLIDTVHPTVRVMRLYKPCMHVVPTMPNLQPNNSILNARSFSQTATPFSGPNFAISQFLLLPDSFGDIYLGELFSAYISVVNGLQDLPFKQVSLTVRLQTSNATHDLYDSRAAKDELAVGQARTLNPNEAVDMVIQHTLSELGTHTLRVSVQYLDHRSNEIRPLRKFYRFNVLNPVVVRSVCTDLGDKFMIQCHVTNATKSMLYVEDVRILSTCKDVEVTKIQRPNSSKSHHLLQSTLSPKGQVEGELAMLLKEDNIFQSFHPDAMPTLLTDESIAYAFIAKKLVPTNSSNFSYMPIGVPEIKWGSCMGEYGYVRGAEIMPALAVTTVSSSSNSLRTSTVLTTPAALSVPENRVIRIVCMSAPAETLVGQEVTVSISIINDTGQAVNLQLKADDSLRPDSGLIMTGLTCANLGMVDIAASLDATVTLFPVTGGIHAVRNLVAVDLITMKEYYAGILCKILVHDDILQAM